MTENELIIMPLSNISYCKAIFSFRSAIIERAHAHVMASDYTDEEKEFSKKIIECNNQMNKILKKVFDKKIN